MQHLPYSTYNKLDRTYYYLPRCSLLFKKSFLSPSPHRLEFTSHKMLTMTHISFGTIGIIMKVDPCRTAIRGGMSPLWFLHQGFCKVCIDIAVCKRHPILVLQVGTC